MSTVLADTRPVARKAHQCDVCYTAIEPGTRYRNSRMQHEGSVYTWREHEECGRVGMASWDRWLDEGYDHETTWEYLRQIAVADLTDDERIVSERMGVHNDD